MNPNRCSPSPIWCWLAAAVVSFSAFPCRTGALEPVGQTPSKVKVFAAEGGFKFVEEGREILVYNRDPIAARNHPRAADGSHARGHYLHPVYDLDGVRMTDDMPADHVHHRGIFWAWTQLYVGEKRLGHPWEQRGLVWDVQDVRVTGDAHSTALHADVVWKSPLHTDAAGKPVPLVREVATIRVHEAEANARTLDFEISLRALLDTVRIGGSTDTKGYGGFSTRIPLPGDLKILGPSGAVEPNTSAPSAAQPWVDFSGSFAGNGRTSGITVMVHPSHPGHPPGWTIRRRESCQNPVFPGRDLFLLPTDAPLVLRYRVVLHRGDKDDARIAQRFEDYAKMYP